MTQDKKQPIPLYSFTQWNNSKNVPALLTAGADFMEQDDFGRTPLHLVASSGNLANIQALLGGGADLMARDKWGKTPLHDASGDHLIIFLRLGKNWLLKSGRKV